MIRLARSGLSLAVASLLAACGGGEEAMPSERDPCSIRVQPGPGDQARLQTALIQAGPGSTICLASGTFHLSEELSSSVPGITLRGSGSDATILDFKGQEPGGSGLFITGDDFRAERLAIRNTGGDGLRLVGADNVALDRLAITWDPASVPAEGSHAIHLLSCTNARISGSVIEGVAGAGIHAEAGSDVTLRANLLRGESSVQIDD